MSRFAFDISLLQRLVCLVSLDVFRAVRLLHRTRSRYLRCLLEVKMSGVIHGLGGLGKIFLVTGGTWRWMRVLRALSYCCASSAALVWSFSIKSKFLISTLKAATSIAFKFCYLIVFGQVQLWNAQVNHYRQGVRNLMRWWKGHNITPFGENHKIINVAMNWVGKFALYHIDLDQKTPEYRWDI